jgi:hypothetical protein
MGGLIEGAKQKIWSIANDFVSRKPSPELRVALVTYRDKGDEYVVKRFDLTDDIDTVYTNLRSFAAGGGGDEPESVNQALDETVHKLSWSKESNVLRVIFLVGDAPPHMDYKDDVKYQVSCQDAAKAGIIINTVQCGNIARCTPAWQEMARLAEGQYIQLAQEGGMAAVTTPYDAEIGKLSADLSKTVVGWGDAKQQADVAKKMEMPAVAAAPAPMAERAAYNLKTGGKAIQGRGDLVADVGEDKVKLEAVKDADLPENMRKMSADERKAYLTQQQAKRTEINAQLDKLSRQRTDYIEAEKKKAASGKGDAFDAKIAEIVNQQAEKKLGH